MTLLGRLPLLPSMRDQPAAPSFSGEAVGSVRKANSVLVYGKCLSLSLGGQGASSRGKQDGNRLVRSRRQWTTNGINA